MAFINRLHLPGLIPLTAALGPDLLDQLPPPHLFFDAAALDGRLVYTNCTVQVEFPFRLAFLRPAPSVASAALRALALVHRYVPTIHLLGSLFLSGSFPPDSSGCMCMVSSFDAFPLLPIASLPREDHFLAPLGLHAILGMSFGGSADDQCDRDVDGFVPGTENPDVKGWRMGRLKGVGSVVYYHDTGSHCMGGLLPPGLTNLPRNRVQSTFGQWVRLPPLGMLRAWSNCYTVCFRFLRLSSSASKQI